MSVATTWPAGQRSAIHTAIDPRPAAISTSPAGLDARTPSARHRIVDLLEKGQPLILGGFPPHRGEAIVGPELTSFRTFSRCTRIGHGLAHDLRPRLKGFSWRRFLWSAIFVPSDISPLMYQSWNRSFPELQVSPDS
jgi:hypothetical protein